ncbi:ParE family toxin-like protein [Desulfonatronum lacustre]|uniref:ParE family toxin-like protein n=1 Tax=Desulfonatronum lacustre TaxID=66849 RepID=UPI000A0219A2
MNSSTTPDFWSAYRELPSDVRRRAKKAYRLWLKNPRHPSLRFKKAGQLWSIRIGSEYRALALHQNAVYYWFWIGRHDAYEQLIADSFFHK